MTDDTASAAIDDHIARSAPEARAALRELRALIRATAPEANERISYGVPTFDLRGRHLVHFAGHARHIGFYPGADAIAAFDEELTPYKRAKGSVQFPVGRPLPVELIRRMVEFRVSALTDVDVMDSRERGPGHGEI